MGAARGRPAAADVGALACLAVLSLWTAHGFLHPDLFPLGHDQAAHMTRLAAFDVALRDGQLPPIWAGDFYFGYGGPVFGFYPSLLYYLATPVLWLGGDVLDAWRVSMVGLTFATAAMMYGWLHRPMGKLGALVGATTLTLAPYHLLDLYVRAAYTEYAAFPCAVAMLWTADAWARTGRRAPWVALVAATAAMIGVHLGSIVMLGPLTAVWLVVLLARRPMPWGRLLGGWAALVVALLLTVGDWLPAFAEKGAIQIDRETQGGYFVHTDHFLDLRELVVPSWGFGISRPDDTEHTSFQLGLVHWGAAVLGPGLLWLANRRRYAAALSVLFLAGIVMTLPVSGAVWSASSVLRSLQFPWRFLLPATIAASAFAGGVLLPLGRFPRVRGAAAVAGLGLVVFAYGRYRVTGVYDQPFSPSSREFLEDARSFGVGQPEYRPAGFTWQPAREPAADVLGAAEIRIADRRRGHVLAFTAHAPAPTVLSVERYAGPGWRATVNGRPSPLATDPVRGTILLTVPAGQSDVVLRYGLTPLRRATLAASALVALGLVVCWWGWPRWVSAERAPAIAIPPDAE